MFLNLCTAGDEIVRRECTIRTRRRDGKWHVLTEKPASKRELHHVINMFLSRTKIKICIIWSGNLPPRGIASFISHDINLLENNLLQSLSHNRHQPHWAES
jgi:hypothetical protein